MQFSKLLSILPTKILQPEKVLHSIFGYKSNIWLKPTRIYSKFWKSKKIVKTGTIEGDCMLLSCHVRVSE